MSYSGYNADEVQDILSPPYLSGYIEGALDGNTDEYLDLKLSVRGHFDDDGNGLLDIEARHLVYDGLREPRRFRAVITEVEEF